MELPADAERVVASGEHGKIEFAVKPTGRMCEAWEWRQALPEKKWHQFEALFERLVENGVIHNETQFKMLSEDVFEFKRGGVRLLCLRTEGRYLLTNTLKKSGRKNISEDIERAKTIGKGHLEWEASSKRLEKK